MFTSKELSLFTKIYYYKRIFGAKIFIDHYFAQIINYLESFDLWLIKMLKYQKFIWQ